MMFDVWVALVFCILEYVMKKQNWPFAPLVTGFILGEIFERY